MTNKMKFLNLDNLYKDESGEQYALYRDYVKNNIRNSKILSFINNYNLHDSVLIDAKRNSDGAISIDLVNGDVETGYRNTTIIYRGAPIIKNTNLNSFNRNGQRPIEVIADEIDVENGIYCHRLLLSNKNIISIEFNDMEVKDNGPGDREAEFLKYR